MKQTLRQAREAKGLSVIELAASSKTSQRSVYEWEYGLRRPRPAKLKALCEVLEVSPNSLILCPAKKVPKIAAFILEAEGLLPEGGGSDDS